MQVKYARGHLGNGLNNSTKLTMGPRPGSLVQKCPVTQSVSFPLPAHMALPQALQDTEKHNLSNSAPGI